jgi:phosphate/sulfate permease
MEFVLAAVVLLFVLAASDLVVGVSNDAVNFLNSAIGSRVAPRRTIMIVASLGILIGATFASGLMEVARKGIFHPELFTFSEVMAIFLAVMLTDILLLDLFNTYGLPTSTTVSIVFELLGAAVAVALFRLTASGEAWTRLPEFINSAKAGEIILGIFLSVGVAFTVGAIVMFIARLLFTFRYGKTGRAVHIVWSGIALSAIAYFLLIKGLKGASFVPEDFRGWTQQNTGQVIAVVWLVMTVVAGILSMLRVSLLHFIVLAGTFALAMAFAGNDLVNFIGVPLAGMESYKAWSVSGVAAEEFTMTVLTEKYQANTFILLLAGAIMAVTLWTSRKARSVTDTEVNLARADAGTERFKGNWIARGVVRLAHNSAKLFGGVVPGTLARNVEARFEPAPPVPNPPAFDLVRASVNLTAAAVLIAIATNMKLPLSTTYVSFMVAMGTSLSDRAWGRESAVFRVSGVLSVIGGWFLTAAIAFTVSGLFALLIRGFGDPAIWGLALVAVATVAHTFRLHRRRAQREDAEKADAAQDEGPQTDPRSKSATDLAELLEAVADAERDALIGIQEDNQRTLRLQRDAIGERLDRNERQMDAIPRRLSRSAAPDAPEGLGRGRLLDHDLRQDLLVSAFSQMRQAEQHVSNLLPPFSKAQAGALSAFDVELQQFLRRCADGLRQGRTGLDADTLASLRLEKRRLLAEVDRLLADRTSHLRQNGGGDRTDALYFHWLLEAKDIVAVAARLVRLHARWMREADASMPLLFDPS